MKAYRLTLFFVLSANYAFALAPNGIVRAAEYYYSRQDYRQALQLWAEVVKKRPDDTVAVLRLAELKLMIEGKRPSQAFLLSWLQVQGRNADGFSRNLVSRKLTQTLSTFVSDESQSFYLQARPKLNFNDCEGALNLLKQSLSLEPENLLTLREKAHCEKQLNQEDAYLATTRFMYALNPYDSMVLEDYFRALFLAKRFSEIVSASNPGTFDFASKNRQLFLIAALIESKSDAEALILIEGLIKEKKEKPFALLYYLKSRVFSRYVSMKKEETSALQIFLAMTEDSSASSLFPEFEIEAKVVESKKRLAELGFDPR